MGRLLAGACWLLPKNDRIGRPQSADHRSPLGSDTPQTSTHPENLGIGALSPMAGLGDQNRRRRWAARLQKQQDPVSEAPNIADGPARASSGGTFGVEMGVKRRRFWAIGSCSRNIDLVFGLSSVARQASINRERIRRADSEASGLNT